MNLYVFPELVVTGHLKLIRKWKKYYQENYVSFYIWLCFVKDGLRSGRHQNSPAEF